MQKLSILRLAFGLVLAGCGDDTSQELRRLPTNPDVQETVIPGQIFTRGPGGKVVARATYAEKEDVHLMGTGLPDGRYFYHITSPDCELLLAGPDSGDSNVPDTARKEIEVAGGVFGPVALAPFNSTSNEEGFYEVQIVPVSQFSAPHVGCFGFPELESVTTEFVVEAQRPETNSTMP